MNITNILNRRLGLVTVANLQRVFNYFSNSLGLVDGAIPDSRPYKVYTALLSQSGTDAPTAVVLENTLGTVVLTRSEIIGNYDLTLTGAFAGEKTFVISSSTNEGAGGNSNEIRVNAFKNGDNIIRVATLEMNFNEGTYTSADSLLFNTPIEIRVYN